ncbi:MAG: hypothetical protein AAB354_10700, partial [candidate division KSB1 bacterium]
DLYEKEVKDIMLNLKVETLRNVLSGVDENKIVAALGSERLIAALGNEKVLADLGGSEFFLKALLASLTPEQRRHLLEEPVQH